jgi:hypothetical protein
VIERGNKCWSVTNVKDVLLFGRKTEVRKEILKDRGIQQRDGQRQHQLFLNGTIDILCYSSSPALSRTLAGSLSQCSPGAVWGFLIRGQRHCQVEDYQGVVEGVNAR